MRGRRRCDGLRLDAHVEERAERMVLRRVGYDVVRERRGDPPLGLDALEEEDEEVVAALAHEGGQDALAGVVVEGGEESALIGEGLEVRRERKTYLDGLEDATDGRVGIQGKEAVNHDVVQEGVVDVDTLFTRSSIESLDESGVLHLVRDSNQTTECERMLPR